MSRWRIEKKFYRFVQPLLLGLVLTATGSVAIAENMIGPQSQNEGMYAVPALGKVTIDGDAKEWDWSGRIWIIPHKSVKNKFSVQTAAMWDKDNLYLGFKWKDPTPAYSTVDPQFIPQHGWKSDCAQLNISTDQSMWVFLWNHTPKNQPVMRQTIWKDLATYRKGQSVKLFAAEPNSTKLGDGIEMAYKINEEGDGCFQEVKIPWAVLYKTVPEIKAGLVFRMGQEYLWGDPTGKTWPIMRYADNMEQGVTSREFFWAGSKPWGKVELVGKNNIKVRQYVSDDEKLQGTIPIRATLPKKASRFTIVIEDLNGKRLRNLAADFDPNDYQVGEENGKRVVEVKWDGLDDQGKLLSPGSYKVRGLYHNGLDAKYEMTFYNPGTPPWVTGNRKGNWGADHSAPRCVTRAGDNMVITFGFAEGGSGIIALDPSGKKFWSEKRGAISAAADDKYIYARSINHSIKDGVIIRMLVKNGKYAPFVKDGKERPFELPLADVLGEGKVPGGVDDMEVHGDTLAIAFEGGSIALLDKTTADLKKRIDVKNPAGLAFAPDGTLYALIDGQVCTVDTTTGAVKALAIDKFENAVDLAADREGNVLVADMGPDQQLKGYGRDGKLLYVIGRKGGRPLMGPYDPQGLHNVQTIEVDSKGRVWATERYDYPRRVVVFNVDGSVVREYIGNTEYAGTGTFLHETKADLGYVGPMEFALDKDTRQWRMTRTLWNPDARPNGHPLKIAHNSHAGGTRFTRVVNGKEREFFFQIPYLQWDPYILLMEEYGKWRPVFAMGCVGAFACEGKRAKYEDNPAGEFKGCDPYDIVIWNDDNEDGDIQRSECEIIKSEKPYGDVNKRNKRAQMPLRMNSGWGGRMDENFVFYLAGGREQQPARVAPIGFAENGAPRYGVKGITKLDYVAGGSLVPLADEERLLIMPFWGGNGDLRSVNPATGDVQWTYPNPYPGVHGSHKALMPKPGLLIGTLKITGVADVNKKVGKVFSMRGNLGQDFFVTTDGLYVGSLFQDGRLPTMTLPNSEAELATMPMSPFTEGGEPFSGWFGKQEDGKIRMTTSMASQGCMIVEITGLNTIKRFDLPNLTVNAEQLAQADKDNVARAAAKAKAKVLVAKAVKGKFGYNMLKNLDQVEMKRTGQPMTGTMKMGYDNENLYVYYKINDTTPWKNLGKVHAELFKTGDAVDLKLCVDAEESKKEKRRGSGQHDLRVIFSQLNGKPVAVLLKPFDKTAPKELEHNYHSSVTDKHFDRVEVLKDAKVKVNVRNGYYDVLASIPLKNLGFTPKPGLVLRGDVGFILSDADGTINTARIYWSNKDTNLVNDMPMESWFSPDKWGTIKFE